MPRVTYSLEEKQRLRQELVAVALELMAKQGIQHTTVEQIYQKVGISRSFFYSFSPPRRILWWKPSIFSSPGFWLMPKN